MHLMVHELILKSKNIYFGWGIPFIKKHIKTNRPKSAGSNFLKSGKEKVLRKKLKNII